METNQMAAKVKKAATKKSETKEEEVIQAAEELTPATPEQPDPGDTQPPVESPEGGETPESPVESPEGSETPESPVESPEGSEAPENEDAIAEAIKKEAAELLEKSGADHAWRCPVRGYWFVDDTLAKEYAKTRNVTLEKFTK